MAVSRAQASTHGPFETGCLERLDGVWAYVRVSVASFHDAEDITHDVFIHACKMRHQFAGGDPGAWLYQIARSKVSQFHRRKSVERRSRKVIEEQVKHAAATPEEAGWLNDSEQLHAALAALDDNEREVLRLKFSHFYTNAEIARLLEIDPSYLGVIVFRALRKLRRQLKGRDE